MNGQIFIATHDPVRLHVWRRVFRSDRVPVKSATPRWQVIPGQRYEVSAYDLDAGRLLPKQARRFCRYLSRVYKVSEIEAAKMMDGWPIPEANCQVIIAAPKTTRRADLTQ